MMKGIVSCVLLMSISLGLSAVSPTVNKSFVEEVGAVPFNMIFVKSGVFVMGNNKGGDTDERPSHSVIVSDFYIGQTEVTVAQFKVFVDSTNYVTDAEKMGGSYRWDGKEWKLMAGVNWRYDTDEERCTEGNSDLPVINVSWNDAVAYCKWLSKQTKKNYRLPTEAEWEFAAMGGTQSQGYDYAGSDKLEEVAWYIDNAQEKTHPVKSKLPNELDIYDMTGNVWEWCSDWKGNYSNAPQLDPLGPTTGTNRVSRGGSWHVDEQRCRIKNRGNSYPAFRNFIIGFRIAMSNS